MLSFYKIIKNLKKIVDFLLRLELVLLPEILLIKYIFSTAVLDKETYVQKLRSNKLT